MTRRFLGHYRQQPNEVLRYSVDYSQWLGTGETLVSVDVYVDLVTTPPLSVDSEVFITDDDLGFTFVVSGGLSGTQYQVTARATTSADQVVEREINFTIEEL